MRSSIGTFALRVAAIGDLRSSKAWSGRSALIAPDWIIYSRICRAESE
jgi:hypothetical protein